tara:strand:+ start:242 stop:808 length:567 start_codon:yes stop_codon:yes gene_type:complete
MAYFEGATIDDIYEAFAHAETGGEEDPWIRTKFAPEEGSDAYGPVQMLSSFVEGAVSQQTKEGKSMIDFSKDELAFIDRFQKQGEKFYEFGKEPTKEGYDPRYDYGGLGDISKEDRKLYESVAKKIMSYELKRVGGIYDLKRSWRFGPKGGKDPRYFKDFDRKLKSILDDKDTAVMFPDETAMDSMLS